MKKNQTLSAVTAGLLILAGAGASIAARQSEPLPDLTASIPVVEADAGSATFSCSGGLERTMGEGINVEEADENIRSWAQLIASDDALALIPEWYDHATNTPSTLMVKPLTANTKTALGVEALDGTVTLTGKGPRILLAGANTHLASAGDLEGIAVNPCMWAKSSHWLVGSSGQIGASNRLVMTNPGLVPVQVNLAGYSSVGPMKLGTTAVALPPQSTTELLLDGLISTDARIAIHASSAAGRFTASLQSTKLSGYTADGVSFVTGSVLGADLVIPGLVVPAGESAAAPLGGKAPDSVRAGAQAESILRLVNPDSVQRTVSITTVGTDGAKPLPGGEDVEIAPGAVLDLTLSGLAPGSYALRIHANGDVAAAIQAAQPSKHGIDRAWLPASEPMLAGAAAFGAIPAKLSLTGDGIKATWKAFNDDGELESGTVTVEGNAAVDLPKNTTYVTVEADQQFRGAVYLHGEGVEWVPLTANMAGQQSLRIDAVN